MRCVIALLATVALLIPPASAAPPRPSEFTSRDAVLGWMWTYRAKPNPAGVAPVMRAASQLGLIRDPEASGVFVGFLAGVIAADPRKAEDIMGKLLPLAAGEQWVIVRAIAYSGAPEWKNLLRKFAGRLPARKAMIDKYLAGKLPTLDQLVLKADPAWYETAWSYVRVDKYFGGSAFEKEVALEPSDDLIDALWGYYLATGAYTPVARIIAMLPWSKDHDSADRLTIGSMAKYTLTTNAARDPTILALLKWSATQHHPKGVVPILNDAIDAAETAETARVRKEALAALEELRRKGPGYKRKVAWWGQVGEGAISLGCLGAAVAGQVEFGIPCVVGGALTSAGLRYWATQD